MVGSRGLGLAAGRRDLGAGRWELGMGARSWEELEAGDGELGVGKVCGLKAGSRAVTWEGRSWRLLAGS